jgi:hypothetical protein
MYNTGPDPHPKKIFFPNLQFFLVDESVLVRGKDYNIKIR